MNGDTSRRDANGVFTDRQPLNKPYGKGSNAEVVTSPNKGNSAMMISYNKNDDMAEKKKK